MNISYIYENRHLIPEGHTKRFEDHRKYNLSTVEMIGLETVLCEFVKQYEESEFGECYGKPLSKTSSYTLWINLMVRAGLADKLDEPKNANDIRRCYKPRISAYYLRHNYITMCWKAGMDPLVVQRIVGHKDYRTTANIYTHLNEEHLSKAYDDISSVFNAEKNKVAQKLHKASSDFRGK